jgi:hypothetical protein
MNKLINTIVTLDYTAIIVATIAQFIFGWVWYGPIFGKFWGKIHGFEAQTPEVQAAMMKDMWKLLVPQFVATLVTTFVFALLVTEFPSEWNRFGLAGFFWLGFVVPTQLAANMFGGTKPEWLVKKTLVMAAASFISLEIIALVFQLMR